MKIIFGNGEENIVNKKYEVSTTLAEILQAASNYYFEKGAIDIYDMHIVFHVVHQSLNKEGQTEIVSFLKSDEDFMGVHADDWSLILNDLRKKYNSRKALWQSLINGKDEIESNFTLFYLLVVYEIDNKIYQKILKKFTELYDEHFEDYLNSVKKSENFYVIKKGEPWIRVYSIKPKLSLNEFEELLMKLISEVKNEYVNTINKREITTPNNNELDNEIALILKKYYPYIDSRNDTAFVFYYKLKLEDKILDIPLFGIIYSNTGEESDASI